MTATGKRVIASLVLGGLVSALTGCQEPEGPAERAGKEIDRGMVKAGQVLEEAGKKIQDTAKNAKK